MSDAARSGIMGRQRSLKRSGDVSAASMRYTVETRAVGGSLMSGMAPRRAGATLSDYEAFIAPLPENER